jgi:hypothetical protein
MIFPLKVEKEYNQLLADNTADLRRQINNLVGFIIRYFALFVLASLFFLIRKFNFAAGWLLVCWRYHI